MAITRIQSTSTQGTQNKEQLESQAKRQQLNQTFSTFERTGQGPKSVQFANGQSISLPVGNQAEEKKLQSVYANLSPENKEKLSGIERQLNTNIKDAIGSGEDITTLTSSGSALSQTFHRSAEEFFATTGLDDQNEAVNTFLFMGVSGFEKDLGNFAKEVQGKNELAAEMRTDIAELQDEIVNWPEGVESQEFSWNEVTTDADGNVIIELKTETLTKEQAQSLVDKLTAQRASFSELTKMDQFDLQRQTEMYTQAFNIISAIIKEQNTQLQNILRNIKAS